MSKRSRSSSSSLKYVSVALQQIGMVTKTTTGSTFIVATAPEAMCTDPSELFERFLERLMGVTKLKFHIFTLDDYSSNPYLIHFFKHFNKVARKTNQIKVNSFTNFNNYVPKFYKMANDKKRETFIDLLRPELKKITIEDKALSDIQTILFDYDPDIDPNPPNFNNLADIYLANMIYNKIQTVPTTRNVFVFYAPKSITDYVYKYLDLTVDSELYCSTNILDVAHIRDLYFSTTKNSQSSSISFKGQLSSCEQYSKAWAKRASAQNNKTDMTQYCQIVPLFKINQLNAQRLYYYTYRGQKIYLIGERHDMKHECLPTDTTVYFDGLLDAYLTEFSTQKVDVMIERSVPGTGKISQPFQQEIFTQSVGLNSLNHYMRQNVDNKNLFSHFVDLRHVFQPNLTDDIVDMYYKQITYSKQQFKVFKTIIYELLRTEKKLVKQLSQIQDEQLRNFIHDYFINEFNDCEKDITSGSIINMVTILMDFYTVVRMLRHFYGKPLPVIFFYGGTTHVENLSKFFDALPGAVRVYKSKGTNFKSCTQIDTTILFT